MTKYIYSELEGKIKAKYGSNLEFCKRIGMSPSLFSLKLHNKSKFTIDEIRKIVVALDMKDDEFKTLFMQETKEENHLM